MDGCIEFFKQLGIYSADYHVLQKNMAAWQLKEEGKVVRPSDMYKQASLMMHFKSCKQSFQAGQKQ